MLSSGFPPTATPPELSRGSQKSGEVALPSDRPSGDGKVDCLLLSSSSSFSPKCLCFGGWGGTANGLIGFVSSVIQWCFQPVLEGFFWVVYV